MSLQEKLKNMKEESIRTKPPEIVGPLLEETGKLVASGITDKAIKAGERLPEFELLDSQGNVFSSVDLLAKGPLAISFYRGVW